MADSNGNGDGVQFSAAMMTAKNVTLSRSGVEIEARSPTGDLVGTLTVLPGSIRWRKPNGKRATQLKWQQLADFMEQVEGLRAR